MDAKELIARRVALELRDRTLVNLGIGLPTLVARYVPHGISVAFQSENGIIGFGAPPPDGHGRSVPDRRRRRLHFGAARRRRVSTAGRASRSSGADIST